VTEIPFKLRALQRLTEALQEITTANGYKTNLGADVFRGRMWFGESDPLPMVSILEGVNPADDVWEPNYRTDGESYDWPILIQGFVKDDPLNPTDAAYVLLADVRRRLAEEKIRPLAGSRSTPDPFGFGAGKNRVTGLDIGAGVVRPADDVSSKAYFWLTLTMRIVESAADPYA